MRAFVPGKPFDSGRAKAERQRIDVRAIETATAMLLHAIGEDPSRSGLVDTPARVARAYAEVFAGLHEDPTVHLDRTFDGESDRGLVLQTAIPFYSVCEHHLVPFFGKGHIGYIPNQDKPRLVGLSKLARLLRGYAARPQIQERLTAQVADAIMAKLKPYGVSW